MSSGRPDGAIAVDASAADGLPGGFSAPAPFGTASVESIRFDDARVGYAAVSDTAGHGLYRMRDHSTAWEPLDVNARPFGIGFSPGTTRLWVVGNGPAYASTDHGASFTRLVLPSDFHGSAHLWDDATGVVTSETGDRVHRTVDGGATWETHAFTRDVLPGTRAIATSGDHLWIAGGPSAVGAHVAHSPDRGATWEVTALTDQAHDRKGGTLLAAVALSATDVWVVGANRQVFHTVDGFATVTQIAGLPAGVLHVCAITVAGGVVRLAVSTTTHRYAILESTDGDHFQQIAELPAPLAWDAQGIEGMTLLPAGGYVFYGYAGLYYEHS